MKPICETTVTADFHFFGSRNVAISAQAQQKWSKYEQMYQ